MEKIKNFIIKNLRLIIGGILLICFILILIFKLDGKPANKNNPSSSGNASVLVENKNDALEYLIMGYYDAYAKGSVDTISQYAMPISENELSYISLYSTYIDNFSVKKIYTAPGIDDDSCLVSVEIAIKFKDIETEAPGLDFFFVRGLTTGEIYISNLYSQFNVKTKEYVLDSDVEKCINSFEKSNDLHELQNRVQTEYEEAISKDADLEKLINTTIAQSLSDWMDGIVLVQNQNPPMYALSSDEDSNTEDADNDENSSEEENNDEDDSNESSNEKVVLPEGKTVKEYVKTTDKVNVRSKASTAGNVVMTAKKGQKFRVLNMDSWGEWTKVRSSDGKEGFIRNDFLKTCSNKYSLLGTEGYPKKGKKVEIADVSNLITKMSDKGKVITSLSKGTTVKIIQIYANGYSKIITNGRTGYVLTENLSLDN